MRVRVGARGAIALTQLLIAGGVVLGGAGAGVGLQEAGVFGGGDETVAVALDAVSTSDCPDGSDVGELRRGDRVLATGRDEAGAWVEVRDPEDLGSRVWVAARYLIPDSELGGLDVRECGEDDEVAAPTTLPEAPTTLPPGVTTTTKKAGGVPAPGPAPGPAPDTAGPSIGAVGANPASFFEQAGSCSPETTTVSAPVSDPSGIASVVMFWSSSAGSGSKPMGGGGTYTATLGPFATAPMTFTPISITVRATDGAGNVSQAGGSAELQDCVI